MSRVHKLHKPHFLFHDKKHTHHVARKRTDWVHKGVDRPAVDQIWDNYMTNDAEVRHVAPPNFSSLSRIDRLAISRGKERPNGKINPYIPKRNYNANVLAQNNKKYFHRGMIEAFESDYHNKLMFMERAQVNLNVHGPENYKHV